MMVCSENCTEKESGLENAATALSTEVPVTDGAMETVETDGNPKPQSSDHIKGSKRSSKKRKVEFQMDNDHESSEEDDDRNLHHESFGGAEMFGIPLDERRQKAPKRLVQSKAYAELIEDRIQDLEIKIRQILREPEPELGKLEETSREPPASKPTISELVWSDFGARSEVEATKNWRHRPEVDTTPKSVIEILVEEPRYQYDRSTKTVNYPAAEKTDDGITSDFSNLNPEHDKPKPTAVIEKNDTTIPFRIRIRSRPLLKILQDITSLRTVVGPHKHILVFFRPFKILVAYAGELRKHLKYLDKIAANNETMGSSTHSPFPEKMQFGPTKESDTPEAREALRLLCKLIDDHLQPKVQMRLGLDPTIKSVSFNDLWYIFKPGYEVRTPGRTRIQVYRIMKVTGGREVMLPFAEAPGNSPAVKLKQKGYSVGSFVIECFYIHFDGSQFGPVNVTFQIRKFEGERNITTFPIMPFRCDEDQDATRQMLLERGNKFAELAKPRSNRPAHLEYKGLTLGERKEQVESQVIIDFELAFIHKPEERPEIGIDNLVDDDKREIGDTWKRCSACREPGCCGNDIVYDDYEVDAKDRNEFKIPHKSIFDTVDLVEQLTDDQRVLLPHKLFGFTLRSRRWDIFDLDLLKAVDYGDGWKNLVIPERTKETVLALVQNHARPQAVEQQVDDALSSVDLVRGKGKGLIILLHGEPGVGKTSTAECVADHTKRPLFPITCGDIGETAQTVESSLETNFQLAHKWGCVLLLDEADIFLTKRSNNDIRRNAIVSVFLRSLEYYSGILFLTTNRVGTIDRAFKSRIHLTLYFPKLDKARTKKLWENNINRLDQQFKEQKQNFEIEAEEILEFCKKHFKDLERENLRVWNGRQIRNAFQTAAAMAIYEGLAKNKTPVLGASQFQKVADSAKEFDKYLEDLNQGKDDAAQAQEAKLSLDDWEGLRLMRSRPPPIRRRNSVYRRKGRSEEEDDWHSDEYAHEDESESDFNEESPHGMAKGKGKASYREQGKPRRPRR